MYKNLSSPLLKEEKKIIKSNGLIIVICINLHKEEKNIWSANEIASQINLNCELQAFLTLSFFTYVHVNSYRRL